MEVAKQQGQYQFQMHSKFKIWRHLFLVVTLLTIIFNQIFFTYHDCIALLGNRIYGICFVASIPYLYVVYLNLHTLVPKILLKQAYGLYLLILFLVTFSLHPLLLVLEYFVRTAFLLPHRIASYTSPLILVESLATTIVTLICFLGTSSITLLNTWFSEKQRVTALEQEYMQSEVTALKEQIRPDFLSKILCNAAALTKKDPQKSSEMLMQLGLLLRYQLYDCSRDKVLINSEIEFLTSYLKLEQLCSAEFSYTVLVDDKIKVSNRFIAPLLLITFVQQMINKPDSQNIHLSFGLTKNGELIFECQTNSQESLADHDLYAIRKRLDLLYPHHTLSVNENKVTLQLNLNYNKVLSE